MSIYAMQEQRQGTNTWRTLYEYNLKFDTLACSNSELGLEVSLPLAPRIIPEERNVHPWRGARDLMQHGEYTSMPNKLTLSHTLRVYKAASAGVIYP